MTHVRESSAMSGHRPLGILVRYWFAWRLVLDLCGLPLRMRLVSLPTLLREMTASRAREASTRAPDLADAVSLIVTVCQLRVFRLRPFPRSCLRQSLTMYRALARMGYPVRIHFGVQKRGSALQGHSWVTLAGKPLAEPASPTAFTAVYSYPDQ